MLLAESFDACPILYIGYDVHETSILCLKLVDQIMRYLMVVVS